ncbi:MAG: type VI secretion system baseplate subunit TssG [Azoarcus sp.]|jgi:type VI secretion system protein ImpH|nr:type VI secretion system baseplate subunit TssG [Azoarcus sp.]
MAGEVAEMVSPFKREPRDLTRELEQDAPRFGFFQAVRLLALAAKQSGGKRHSRLPSNLRFRTEASFAFPASELKRYQPIDPETPDAEHKNDEMTVAFMGLIGPSGTLPLSYTELVISRRKAYRDTGLHAFLDMFNHRAIALFYDAWRKYRYWLDAEDGERDGLTRDLLDFAGVGFKSLREKLGLGGSTHLAENLFAFYAGLLAQKPISASAMSTVIQGYFGVPAEIEQFVGQWIEVPPEEQSRIGGDSCVPGQTLFAGKRIWDRQTKIQVRMGPMRRAQFDRLMPGEPGAKALETLVRFMVGHGLACDVKLILDKRDVPVPRLDPGQRLMPGRNFWLIKNHLLERDPDEMRFRLLS